MKAIRNDAYANRFLSSFARDDDMAQYISMRDIKLSMYKVSHNKARENRTAETGGYKGNGL